jgi:drug/metabolite transporter (DMT)-like permease
MDTSRLATLTTLTAEIALALHPILIKQIGVGLPTQLFARLGTYSALGYAMADSKDVAASWGSLSKGLQSGLYGLMNLVHIGSSYLSYQHLPAGSALAIFYTYPFFNILAGVILLGDAFDWRILPLLGLAFFGVLLIALHTKNGHDQDVEKDHQKKNVAIGVGAALVSALTETLIFLVAKTGETQTPWLTILKLYPAAFAGLLAYIGYTGVQWKTNLSNWTPLLIFNIFIGFLGYSLRFWSIPRLSTAIFSILTFIGVAAGYAWGLVYAKEVPSAGALTGAACITGALGFLKIIQRF